MNKKSIAKKSAKSKKATHAEERKRLARDLSAALNNPAIPVGLYNDITQAICDLSMHIDYDSPELIELALIGADEFSKRGGKE